MVDITKYEIMAAKEGVEITAEIEELLTAIALAHITDMDKAEDKGFEKGYHRGYKEGHDKGWETGYNEGKNDKTLENYEAASTDYVESEKVYNDGYDEGRKEGYADGWRDGRKAGKQL